MTHLTTEQVSHTPGPWVVFWGRGLGAYPLSVGTSRFNVVTAMGRKAHPEAAANARLIAAAPELLAAARLCLESDAFDYHDGLAQGCEKCVAVAAIKAAIAKAEGRS